MSSRSVSLVSVISTTIVTIGVAVFAWFQSVDWASVGKTWGPLGIFFVVGIILVWQGAKMAKQMLTDTVSDARRERDSQRQLLKEQATEFITHIKQENDQFRSALKDVVDAFERTGRKR